MSDESTITEAQTKALTAIAKAAAKNADEDGFVSALAVKGLRPETIDALQAAGRLEVRPDGGPAPWLKVVDA